MKTDTHKMEPMVVDPQQHVEYPWAKESLLYMIQEIKSNPSLYDRKNTDYNDRKVRGAILTEIAENVQKKYTTRCTRQDILEKWVEVKYNYFMEKKKVDQYLNEENRVYKPVYYWFEPMSFIEPYVLPSDVPSTMRELLAFKAAHAKVKPQRASASLRASEAAFMSVMNFDPQLQLGRSGQPKRMRRMDAVNADKDEDSFDIFGRFVASELRSITTMGNKYIARRGKRRIQRCLIDMWDQVDYHSSDDDEQSEDSLSPSPSPPPPPSPPPFSHFTVQLN